MALVLVGVVVAVWFALISVAVLVQGLRQSRDDAGVDEQRASLVDLRGTRTETRGDEAARAGVSTDEASSVSGYHFNLFI